MQEDNKYFINSNGAESARLIDQEHIFTAALSGLFPVEIEPVSIGTVLDLACGPGEWASEVVFKYPHIEVTGVDIDPDMVSYARAMARVGFRDNVTFEVMDVKKLLDFPSRSFDFINGRLLFGFMDRESWPKLLAECYRVLTPGGVLCLTEYEVTISNSTALQYLLKCLYKALADQERTYSVDRGSVGICHMLDKLLKEARFKDTVGRPFHLDSSYGMPGYLAGNRNTYNALALMKPYLLEAGSLAAEEYERLHQQMQIDMLSDTYVNISFGLQAWGYKP